jgi:penicillin-binding protein 1B
MRSPHRVCLMSRAPSQPARPARRLRLPGRTFRIALVVCGLLGLGLVLWLLWPFWQLSGRFAERTSRQPSRLFARSEVLAVGQAMLPRDLAAVLASARYRAWPANAGAEPPMGTYRLVETVPNVAAAAAPGPTRDGVALVALRRYPTVEGPGGGQRLEVRLQGGAIAALTLGGVRVDRVLLDPPQLAAFFGPQTEERRPVVLADLPEHVYRAVLAAEDARFFTHAGISVLGIVRAVWANLTSDGGLQGGSTLTQQLVKNIFLTHERSLARKAREAVLALLLELRYSKEELLQAYLNEIFWGRSDGVNLIGLGAVSWAYYGKDPSALTLDEAALLAGIIQAPNALSPRNHAEKARARRDWVLSRLVELEWAPAVEVEAARARPIALDPLPLARRRGGSFAETALAEAKRRYGVAELADTGYALFATVDPTEQEAAEAILRRGLEELEQGPERGRRGESPLQAALVSLDPRSGEVLAWVGGRDNRASQFDRVVQARRQVGSAIKPVVLAAALVDGFQPASLVDDAPLQVSMAGRLWAPQNDDGEFLGWISLRQAMEESRNVPIARLALQSGLPRVAALAHDLGLERQPLPLPSLALGAVEASPLELARVYGTFANGGLRPPPATTLLAVWNRYGERLPDGEREVATPVLPPAIAYLVTSVLQGVLDRGTGTAARAEGLRDPLAGKSGTTNERRDAWFAGYAADRVTVVWVGRDDNTPTRLSGGRAAVPIWARFMQEVRPREGYPRFVRPEGLVEALIDPASGELATDLCPERVVEVFQAGRVPGSACRLHLAVPAWTPPPPPTPERKRGFWQRIFGGGEKPPADGG